MEDFFSGIGKKLSGAARTVQERTKDGVEITKLMSEIRSANNELQRQYLELGKMSYAVHEGNADGAELEALCDGIRALLNQIESLNNAKEKIQRQGRCPNCGAVMSADARFCVSCGTKMPEEPKAETCPQCGAARVPGARFCTTCRHDFTAVAEPTEE